MGVCETMDFMELSHKFARVSVNEPEMVTSLSTSDDWCDFRRQEIPLAEHEIRTRGNAVRVRTSKAFERSNINDSRAHRDMMLQVPRCD